MDAYHRSSEAAGREGNSRRVPPSTLEEIELNEETRQRALQSVMKELDQEVKQTLDRASSSIVEETRNRLQKELSAALEAFGKEASIRLRLLEEEHLARSMGKLQAQMTERVQEQIKEIESTLNKPCLELKTLAAQADAAVNSMATAVEAAAKKLQTAEQKVELRFSGAADELQKVADSLLQSSASRLERQADETALRLTGNLRGAESSFVAESSKHAAALKQELLDSLSKEADAIAEECRTKARQPLSPGLQLPLPQSEVQRRQRETKEPELPRQGNPQKSDSESIATPQEKAFNRAWPDLTTPLGTSSSTPKVPDKPYAKTPRGMEVARSTPSRPVLQTSAESRSAPTAISISLALLLLAIFVATCYYSLRRGQGQHLPSTRNAPAIVDQAPALAPMGTSRAPMESKSDKAANLPLAENKPAGMAPNQPSSLPERSLSRLTRPHLTNPADSLPAAAADQGLSRVTAGRGDLTVTSNVPGAQIALEGRANPNWVTPHTFTGLPAHLYVVKVYKDGYEPALQSVKVAPGSGASVNARLGMASGEITIITNPPRLDVSVDGKSYGPSPARAVLPVGEHTYTVSPPPGKASLTKAFTIRANGDILKDIVSW
jgi:hypothetical protein